jgi:hypothetical protein
LGFLIVLGRAEPSHLRLDKALDRIRRWMRGEPSVAMWRSQDALDVLAFAMADHVVSVLAREDVEDAEDVSAAEIEDLIEDAELDRFNAEFDVDRAKIRDLAATLIARFVSLRDRVPDAASRVKFGSIDPISLLVLPCVLSGGLDEELGRLVDAWPVDGDINAWFAGSIKPACSDVVLGRDLLAVV